LVDFDVVADLDRQLDDLGLARRADVRHVDVLHARRGSSGRRRGGGRCWSRGSSRRGSLGRSGGWGSARHLQHQDQVAGTHFVVQLDADAFHHAGFRRRDFHAGLVRFQGDQRLISLDGVADLDRDLDDLGLARRTDVRHVHVLAGGSSGRGRCCSRRRGCGCLWRSSRGGSGRRRRRGCCGSTLDFQLQHVVAFFQAVAQLDLDGLDHAGLGSRDFHARLVRLQGQQALVGFNAVADLHQQFNYFTLTAADVRYANDLAHENSPQQSSGLRFSGSIPNFTMASATTLGSMSPRSAKASRAASTTKWRSTSKK